MREVVLVDFAGDTFLCTADARVRREYDEDPPAPNADAAEVLRKPKAVWLDVFDKQAGRVRHSVRLRTCPERDYHVVTTIVGTVQVTRCWTGSAPEVARSVPGYWAYVAPAVAGIVPDGAP